MAAVLRGARAAGAGRRPALRHERRPRETAAELRPTLAERFLERTTAEWLATLEAADIPAGPINDILEAFASPEAVARRDDGRAGAPGVGRRSARSACPFELSAHAGLDPDRRHRCSAPIRTRSWPRPATTPTEIEALRARRSSDRLLELLAPERPSAAAPRASRDEDDASRATGTTTSPAATASPVASAIAGPASPPGVNGATLGIAETIDRTSSATNPIPAAAAVEPVTVLPRKVIAAQAHKPSQARPAERDPAATAGGSNRIAV